MGAHPSGIPIGEFQTKTEVHPLQPSGRTCHSFKTNAKSDETRSNRRSVFLGLEPPRFKVRREKLRDRVEGKESAETYEQAGT